jgi:hypothetical protein
MAIPENFFFQSPMIPVVGAVLPPMSPPCQNNDPAICRRSPFSSSQDVDFSGSAV